ncbi:MAG: GAF domain-containing protein [Deltaproteobacteria bacterium]|nr:GAF domain-containing protein [Deltaproteobacteria bacterium]
MIDKILSGFLPKVFWSVAILVASLSICFTAVVIYQQGKLLKQELVRNGLSTVSNLASESKLGVFAENPDLITPALIGVLQERNTLYAGAYNMEGKPLTIKLASSEHPLPFDKENEPLPVDVRKEIYRQGAPFWREMTVANDTIYELWAPVKVSKVFRDEDIVMDMEAEAIEGENSDLPGDLEKGMIIGVVRVGLSLRSVEASLRDIVLASISVAMLFLPLGFIFAYLLAKRITDPLLRLNRGVEAIEKRGTYEQIDVSSKDEIGHLATSFNRMVDSLSKKDEEINRHLQQLFAINMVASVVNQSLNLKTTLHGALQEVLKVTGMEFGWIYLPARGGKVFEMAAYEGIEAELAAEIRLLKPGEGIAGKVATSGEPIIVDDVSIDARATRLSLLDVKFKAFASIPLRSREETLGAMNITSYASHAFSGDEVKLLRAIGDQIGTAVENSQLYGKLKEQLDEIKKTQEQLLRTAKLASLGELAANVAHEVNNPLTGVLTYTCMMMDNPEGSEKDRKRLKVIHDETMRIRTIVRNLLDFARQSDSRTESMDILDIVGDTLDLISHQAKLSDIEIVEEYAPGIPLIAVDAAQIKQVLLNLFNNAIHAMYDGGILKVKTFASHAWVNIAIEDSGIGMSEEVSSKIFDPFFTTKPETKGTGLGLSVSHGIIEKHGGKIDLKSQAGKGSTFTIKLPIKEYD